MDDIKRIEEKLDTLLDKTHALDQTLTRQEVQLTYHIKRTDLLEESVEIMRNDFRPVEDHVQFIQKLIKLVIAVAAFGGSVAAIHKYLF